MHGTRGFALVITLIVTALLVALVTEFLTEVYVDTTSRQSYVDAQKAGLMAESGVAGAIKMLQFALPQKSYTSLDDLWAKPIDLPEEQGTLRIIVEDENAKLSLNHIVAGSNGTFTDVSSYYGIALRLFKSLKLPASDLCDAVADWVDENDIPKPGGAESQWYAGRKPSFQVKNTWLATFEELALVRGFSGEVLEKIRPFCTLYDDSSGSSKVNINTAPKVLLMALDERITDSVAEQIIDYRMSTPFKLNNGLGNVPGLDSRIVSQLSLHITNKSTIFRIRAEGQVNGTTRVVETVVRFPEGAQATTAPTTLYWREY